MVRLTKHPDAAKLKLHGVYDARCVCVAIDLVLQGRSCRCGAYPGRGEQAKANFLTVFTNAAAQAEGLPSGLKADLLTRASLTNGVAKSFEEELRLYSNMQDSITPESVTAAFRQEWAGGLDLVHVSTKTPIEGGIRMNLWQVSTTGLSVTNGSYVGGIGLSALILPEWQNSEDWH